MRPVNISTGAQRNTETGMVWREILTGAGGGSFELPFQTTFRVSAGGDVVVSLDGVVSMTMRNGEVERFNTGAGVAGNNKSTVTVTISAVDARVQVATDVDPGRRTR